MFSGKDLRSAYVYLHLYSVSEKRFCSKTDIHMRYDFVEPYPIKVRLNVFVLKEIVPEYAIIGAPKRGQFIYCEILTVSGHP